MAEFIFYEHHDPFRPTSSRTSAWGGGYPTSVLQFRGILQRLATRDSPPLPSTASAHRAVLLLQGTLALHPASAHAAAAGRAPVGRRVARAAPDILRAPPVSSARQQATDRPRPRPAIALRQLRTQRHKTKSSGRFSQGRASSGCFLAHIRFRSYDLGVCTARRSSCTHLACRLAQAQGKRTL